MKTLYETYDRDHVPMEEFAGVTLDDLYRVETTFQTNVCVYQLFKPDAEDAEDGKSTAELVRRSLCKYPETRDTFFIHPICPHVLSLVSMSKVW